MNELIEHKVGERFELCKLIYEVRRSDSSCRGCAFHIPAENHCTDYDNQAGGCAGERRSDGQDVIFVQVGET